MANLDINKAVEAMGNVAKLGANLSEAQKDKTPHVVSSSSDDSNNAATGNQTVQISLDNGKRKDQKPVETHIHTFPEARALTPQECDLEWKKTALAADIKREQMAYEQRVSDRQWQHKLEVEKKEDRKRKIAGIIAGVFSALGIGCIGYAVYADYRDAKNACAAPAPVNAEPVKVEATVK